MSRTKPFPMKISRQHYESLVVRTDYLRTLSSGAERIIDEFRSGNVAKRPIKGLNAYQLEQQVMKYADRLFHAEKRIVKETHPDEWLCDDRLKCINAVMLLQDKAANRNYVIGLKPGKFIVELGSVKIEAEYRGEEVLDCTKLIQLWTKANPSHESASET